MPIAERQMPSDPLMRAPWLSALHAALGEDDMLARFRTETGETWTPGSTPLESMIDDATGAGHAFMSRFVDWFNANVWGDLSLAAFGSVVDAPGQADRRGTGTEEPC